MTETTATFLERQAEAALEIVGEQIKTQREIEGILRLKDRRDGQINRILEMGVDNSYVVEMTGGPFSEGRDLTYRVIINGVRSSIVFLSLDRALLAFVMARHNGGNTHDGAFEYAARVLNVPADDA